MKSKKISWKVKPALVQMHGMEHATRILLAAMDRELVERDSYGVPSPPYAIGIIVSTTVQCAWFCEYAIKTFHSFLSDGRCYTGHNCKYLYEHLEKLYMRKKNKPLGELGNRIISEVKSPKGCCPIEWYSCINDVNSTLNLGATNFEDWRYGYSEKEGLNNGVPKGLFVVAKGLELLCRQSFLSQQHSG